MAQAVGRLRFDLRGDANIEAGVIEGFFGRPWDWSARLSVPEFLRHLGFKFYIYAPKADAFLRRRWREPIPQEAMQWLCRLRSRCRDCGIALGIGLTPFEIYSSYDASARISLRSKIAQINEIGAEVLCILFDDMRGDLHDLATLQARVIADVCSWSNARRFIACPTYYSYDERLAREFGSPAKNYLRDFGRLVDPHIEVFWTGEKIISTAYSARHLLEVAAEIGRLPFIWDNHISNDSRIRTNHLFLDPSTETWELPPALVAGLAINPMNQPHLSRIALCGYRRLLSDPTRPSTRSPDGFLDAYDASFAERLIADLELLQVRGLDQLDAAARRVLLDRYDSMRSNPFAREIVGWLRGEYAFDPQCLTV
jgi:hyaluronoglucosaminidase